MDTTCYFSPERFEPDVHAKPSLGVDKEVVRLDVEVRDAAGVQMEEAHGEPAAPSVPVEDGVQVIVRFLVSVRLSGPIQKICSIISIGDCYRSTPILPPRCPNKLFF
jgi:hypothetical protein